MRDVKYFIKAKESALFSAGNKKRANKNVQKPHQGAVAKALISKKH